MPVLMNGLSGFSELKAAICQGILPGNTCCTTPHLYLITGSKGAANLIQFNCDNYAHSLKLRSLNTMGFN